MNLREDRFTVKLHCMSYQVLRDVFNEGDLDLGENSISIRKDSLSSFFHELANEQKPWIGKREWNSFEGELTIIASCELTGKVTFSIYLRTCGDALEDWEFRTDLYSELGQLPAVAAAADTFFKQMPHAY